MALLLSDIPPEELDAAQRAADRLGETLAEFIRCAIVMRTAETPMEITGTVADPFAKGEK